MVEVYVSKTTVFDRLAPNYTHVYYLGSRTDKYKSISIIHTYNSKVTCSNRSLPIDTRQCVWPIPMNSKNTRLILTIQKRFGVKKIEPVIF